MRKPKLHPMAYADPARAKIEEEELDNHIRDLKYMRIARAQAAESKAINHKVGAILVKCNTVISTAYNGPPRDVPEMDNWGRFPDYMLCEIREAAACYYCGRATDEPGRIDHEYEDKDEHHPSTFHLVPYPGL